MDGNPTSAPKDTSSATMASETIPSTSADPQAPPQETRLQPPDIYTPSASPSQTPTLVGLAVPAIPEPEPDSLAPPIPTSSSSPLVQSTTAAEASASTPTPTPPPPSKEPQIELAETSLSLSPVSPPEPQSVPEPQAQAPVPPPTIPQTPQVYITFLLISGHRRTMNFEPATAIGRVKELAWNGWPTDWPSEDRPPAPSYLRILHAGRMLQDDETLSNLKLPTYTPPSPAPAEDHRPPSTIMHISVRPFGGADDVDASGSMKKKMRRRGTRDSTMMSDDPVEEAHSGCCGGCVIC